MSGLDALLGELDSLAGSAAEATQVAQAVVQELGPGNHCEIGHVQAIPTGTPADAGPDLSSLMDDIVASPDGTAASGGGLSSLLDDLAALAPPSPLAAPLPAPLPAPAPVPAASSGSGSDPELARREAAAAEEVLLEAAAQFLAEEGSPSYMRLKAELVKRFGPETFAGQKAAVQQLLTDAEGERRADALLAQMAAGASADMEAAANGASGSAAGSGGGIAGKEGWGGWMKGKKKGQGSSAGVGGVGPGVAAAAGKQTWGQWVKGKQRDAVGANQADTAGRPDAVFGAASEELLQLKHKDDPEAQAVIISCVRRMQAAWKERGQGFVELAQAATRSEQRLTKEIELERRSSSALQGRTAALKDKAAATLQDFATRLEYTQEEAQVLSGKLKSREMQLDQELKDKELLVKQMDGYEQTIAMLKAKVDEASTV